MKKMTRKYYQTTREPLRNGWTAIWNEFVNCKANGAPCLLANIPAQTNGPYEDGRRENGPFPAR